MCTLDIIVVILLSPCRTTKEVRQPTYLFISPAYWHITMLNDIFYLILSLINTLIYLPINTYYTYILINCLKSMEL